VTSVPPAPSSLSSSPPAAPGELRDALEGRRQLGRLSPRAEAALRLLAARLAGGGPEAELTPVDVGVALGLVDELYRADADLLARLDVWYAAVTPPQDDRAVVVPGKDGSP